MSFADSDRSRPKEMSEAHITEEDVTGLILAAKALKGEYKADTTYGVGDTVELAHGFAISRVNGNVGNDPMLSPAHWILLLNGNPMTEYFGRNQTEALPTTEIADTQVVSTDGVIGFTGTAGGDASENGGVSGITIADITTITGADPTVSLENSGITIPAGSHEILAEFYGNQTLTDNPYIRMMQAVDAANDFQWLVSRTRQQFTATGDNDVALHYELYRKIRLSTPQTFYFQLVGYDASSDPPENRVVGYFQIEQNT